MKCNRCGGSGEDPDSEPHAFEFRCRRCNGTGSIESMRLLLCGPMRNHLFYNAPAFADAARLLRAAGYEVVSPVEMDRAAGFDHYRDTVTPAQVAAFQSLFLGAMDNCDGLALIAGWEKSQGVAVEVAKARRLGLPYLPVEAWIGLKR